MDWFSEKDFVELTELEYNSYALKMYILMRNFFESKQSYWLVKQKFNDFAFGSPEEIEGLYDRLKGLKKTGSL